MPTLSSVFQSPLFAGVFVPVMDESLRREYRHSQGHEKLRASRLLIGMGLVLNVAFFVLDQVAIPSAVETAQTIRLGVIIFLYLVWMCIRHPRFLEFYRLVTALALLGMSMSINALILVAGPDDVGSYTYHGGLLLLTFALYSLTYLPMWLSLCISGAFFGCYLAIASALPLPVLLSNIYFFVSTTVIGVVAMSVRERYARENFLLRRALEKDISSKTQEVEKASHLALHDSLTGLANRRGFELAANAQLSAARAADSEVAILFLDLDGFKPVNDTFGHAIGDLILQETGLRLRMASRPDDVVARFGGDEFALCMSVSKKTDVAELAKSIARRLAAKVDTTRGPAWVAASVGVAKYPAEGLDLKLLLRQADGRMYEQKRARRDRRSA